MMKMFSVVMPIAMLVLSRPCFAQQVDFTNSMDSEFVTAFFTPANGGATTRLRVDRGSPVTFAFGTQAIFNIRVVPSDKPNSGFEANGVDVAALAARVGPGGAIPIGGIVEDRCYRVHRCRLRRQTYCVKERVAATFSDGQPGGLLYKAPVIYYSSPVSY